MKKLLLATLLGVTLSSPAFALTEGKDYEILKKTHAANRKRQN